MGRQNLKKISVIILCLCGQPWFHVVKYYNNHQNFVNFVNQNFVNENENCT